MKLKAMGVSILLGLIVAAVLALPASTLPAADAAPNMPGVAWGPPVRAASTNVPYPVFKPLGGPYTDPMLQASMIPLRHFTGDPSDPAWVLFAWFHDGAKMMRWETDDEVVGEDSFGAFRYLTPGNGLPPWPTRDFGWHLSAGDVVWSDELGALLSTPHHAGAGSGQCSVMMTSTDGGSTWSFLSPAPANDNLPCPNGTIALDYGRLLRTLEGRVTTSDDGEYLWLLRAQHVVKSGTTKVADIYAMMLARSNTLAGPYAACHMVGVTVTATCSPFPTPSANKSLFDVGSFIKATGPDGATHNYALYGHGHPTVQYLNVSTDADPMSFKGPGAPLALGGPAPTSPPHTGAQGLVLADSGYIINNPYASGSGAQYMAMAVSVYEQVAWYDKSRGEVWVYSKLG